VDARELVGVVAQMEQHPDLILWEQTAVYHQHLFHHPDILSEDVLEHVGVAVRTVSPQRAGLGIHVKWGTY
jgi:hypothetical protein